MYLKAVLKMLDIQVDKIGIVSNFKELYSGD